MYFWHKGSMTCAPKLQVSGSSVPPRHCLGASLRSLILSSPLFPSTSSYSTPMNDNVALLQPLLFLEHSQSHVALNYFVTILLLWKFQLSHWLCTFSLAQIYVRMKGHKSVCLLSEMSTDWMWPYDVAVHVYPLLQIRLGGLGFTLVWNPNMLICWLRHSVGALWTRNFE